MFRKILIAEDFDSYNLGVKKTMEELKIPIVHQVFYCDDALLKIQKAIAEKAPYELLITDLSFVSDHVEQKLNSGKELILAVKKESPAIKIIVFSIENRYHKIKSMFDKYKIDAFVTKGRKDSKELKKAVRAAYQGKNYISQNNQETSQNIYEFTEYDISLLRLLSHGYTQKEVESYLKEKQITPSSGSSIEKRLALLRESLDAKDTKQLLSMVIELGII